MSIVSASVNAQGKRSFTSSAGAALNQKKALAETKESYLLVYENAAEVEIESVIASDARGLARYTTRSNGVLMTATRDDAGTMVVRAFKAGKEFAVPAETAQRFIERGIEMFPVAKSKGTKVPNNYLFGQRLPEKLETLSFDVDF